MAARIEWALGVHLNQRATDYLQDIGLGYSAIKENLLNPVEWWFNSPHNPNREPEPFKAAFFRGEALHTHFLGDAKSGGPVTYKRTYAVKPTAESHPDYLVRKDDLIDACVRFHLSVHGTVEDLTRRLVKAKAPVKILSVEQAKVGRGKKLISAADDERIRKLYQMAMATPASFHMPEGETLLLKDAFKGSLNEVSIFWVDENGIRQRARFDFLKPNFTGDLKSITDWRKGDFRRDLLSEIIYRGYLIQQAHYFEARRQLCIAVAEGRVFGGTKAQRKRLAEIAAAEAWAWLFVFGKMDGAPQLRGIVLDHQNGKFAKAMAQREQALAQHLYYRTLFEGYENQWYDIDVIYEPDDTDWPEFAEFGNS